MGVSKVATVAGALRVPRVVEKDGDGFLSLSYFFCRSNSFRLEELN